MLAFLPYSFLCHVSFYVCYLGMNYNNVIGFLLFIVFIIQFASGILLSCFYGNHCILAFDSCLYIMADVNVGWFIRSLHLAGVSLFVWFLFTHFARGIWIRLKIVYLEAVLTTVWLTGLLLLGLSLIEGFLGYILFWGQMSYWGVTVILNVLSIIPCLGSVLSSLIWCSSSVIVTRLFAIHFVLGSAIGLLIGMHILTLHSLANSNPISTTNTTLIMPFYPLIYKDLFVLFYFVIGSLSFVLFWEPEILGNSDNLIMANALLTPKSILPEWYFLCLYCCLRCLPDKVAGFGVVLLLFLLIAMLFQH